MSPRVTESGALSLAHHCSISFVLVKLLVNRTSQVYAILFQNLFHLALLCSLSLPLPLSHLDGRPEVELLGVLAEHHPRGVHPHEVQVRLAAVDHLLQRDKDHM